MKIKICGLRREADVEAVNFAMPDYCGFVFAESRRQIDAKTAGKLRARLNAKIAAVGVFVNQPIDVISSLYCDGIIQLVQLHGD